MEECGTSVVRDELDPTSDYTMVRELSEECGDEEPQAKEERLDSTAESTITTVWQLRVGSLVTATELGHY